VLAVNHSAQGRFCSSSGLLRFDRHRVDSASLTNGSNHENQPCAIVALMITDRCLHAPLARTGIINATIAQGLFSWVTPCWLEMLNLLGVCQF